MRAPVVLCDYCATIASHIYDNETLCKLHQHEHGTRYFQTPQETRAARDRARRVNGTPGTPGTPGT